MLEASEIPLDGGCGNVEHFRSLLDGIVGVAARVDRFLQARLESDLLFPQVPKVDVHGERRKRDGWRWCGGSLLLPELLHFVGFLDVAEDDRSSYSIFLVRRPEAHSVLPHVVNSQLQVLQEIRVRHAFDLRVDPFAHRLVLWLVVNRFRFLLRLVRFHLELLRLVDVLLVQIFLLDVLHLLPRAFSCIHHLPTLVAFVLVKENRLDVVVRLKILVELQLHLHLRRHIRHASDRQAAALLAEPFLCQILLAARRLAVSFVAFDQVHQDRNLLLAVELAAKRNELLQERFVDVNLAGVEELDEAQNNFGAVVREENFVLMVVGVLEEIFEERRREAQNQFVRFHFNFFRADESLQIQTNRKMLKLKFNKKTYDIHKLVIVINAGHRVSEEILAEHEEWLLVLHTKLILLFFHHWRLFS